jgi:hypothetical protein
LRVGIEIDNPEIRSTNQFERLAGAPHLLPARIEDPAIVEHGGQHADGQPGNARRLIPLVSRPFTSI